MSTAICATCVCSDRLELTAAQIQEHDVPVKLASGAILHWRVDDLTTFRSFRFSFATWYVQQRVLEVARERMVAEFTKVVEFGRHAGL